MNTRRGLRWLLLATLLLTLVSLWRKRQAAIVAAVEQRATALRFATNEKPGSDALPSRLEPWSIEPARRDPFLTADVPVAAPSLPKTEPPPALFTPPTAPALNYRYLGSMTTPDGRRITLLARGEAIVPVEAGTSLDEGYAVESIGPQAVRLVHPAFATVVDVVVPSAAGKP